MQSISYFSVAAIFAAIGYTHLAVSDTIGADGELAPDPLNATYRIGGHTIHLRNGHYQVQAAPGSATQVEAVALDPVYGDLDGDKNEDAALLLVYTSGGSGTFYYVVAALNIDGHYRGSNGVVLGDRVTPQEVMLRDGVITANYLGRRPEEAMTVIPSVAKSKYLTLEGDRLKEPGFTRCPVIKDIFQGLSENLPAQ